MLLVLALELIDVRLAVRAMALIGVITLSVLLIVPRLMKVERLARWYEPLLKIAEQSKWMGIWTIAWLSLHATLAVLIYAPLPLRLGSLMSFVTAQPIILAAISWLILLILLALSNNWSYQHVRYWKHINMLVWSIPFLGLAHSLLAAQRYRHELPFLLATPLLLLASAVAGYSALLIKKRDYFLVIRLGLLTAGGVVAVIVAVA